MQKQLILLFVCLLLVSMSVTSFADQHESKDRSLYKRLGGIEGIAPVVSNFLDRLISNPVLNANPRIDEARRGVPKAYLLYHVTAFVCQATGGPCSYTGRTMKESHKHLKIKNHEWEAMMADFQESLYEFEVPERERKELVSLLETTRKDIVVSEVED